jgi:hypothetical protein
MKDNTEEIKYLLAKALSDVPNDFALSEVKYHIRAALGVIEHVENKRIKRQTSLEKRKSENTTSAVLDPFRTIRAIDEEIAKEKSRLEQLKQRKNQADDEKDNGDEFQTVFG